MRRPSGKRSSRLGVICSWAIAMLLLAGICGCVPPGSEGPVRVVVSDNNLPQERIMTTAEITEASRGEGELWWYTSMPAPEARQFLDLFAAKYPFIHTQLVRGGTFELVQRVNNELQQGRVQADVLHVLDPATFVDLKKRGELLRYNSPEASAIGMDYRDPGYWTGMRLITLCMAYDTRRTTPSQAPDSWEALLDSNLKGRMGLKDAQTAGSAYAQYYYLRERYGTAFWERLAAQRPRVVKTAEENLQALLAGQIDVIGGIMGYPVYAAMQKGKPVEVIWPKDGVPIVLAPVAILKRAPHPNAAKLFVDFTLSAEGQAALRDLLGTYSVRPGIAPPEGRPRLDELNLASPTDGWEEFAMKQAALRAEYVRLFHPEAE